MIIEQIKNRDFLKETIENIKKENKSANLELLEKTIGALFLVECLVIENKFLIDIEVLTAASKVLYLIKLIRNKAETIEKYNKEIKLKKIEIPLKYRKRLKRINTYNEEAYYYILKSLEI